eukprot:Protomagalhaensia_wolfi_Nauph_80__5809@NODE_725_length_2065_cov_2971_686081_g541_i0_p1_GENE_NODE_725_length_2065_cov_2971_686081_g541_i0NODE_725_length_2065_cov_2971_686081_g541_i0_p1_ORF_typecomplete_len257_score30_01_NODE_725_length_2065_cov_2971_686081_g541_i012221992
MVFIKFMLTFATFAGAQVVTELFLRGTCPEPQCTSDQIATYEDLKICKAALDAADWSTCEITAAVTATVAENSVFSSCVQEVTPTQIVVYTDLATMPGMEAITELNAVPTETDRTMTLKLSQPVPVGNTNCRLHPLALAEPPQEEACGGDLNKIPSDMETPAILIMSGSDSATFIPHRTQLLVTLSDACGDLAAATVSGSAYLIIELRSEFAPEPSTEPAIVASSEEGVVTEETSGAEQIFATAAALSLLAYTVTI